MDTNFIANRERIRRNIVEFAKTNCHQKGTAPSAREIDERFGISFWAYFPSGINELYERCGFDFTPEENKRKLINQGIEKKLLEGDRMKARKKILNFVKEEFKRSGRLNQVMIAKRFKINVSTYFPNGMKEIYDLANIKAPSILCDKAEIRTRILDYVRKQSREGYYPTYTELSEKLRINVNSYFGSIRDVYQEAGVDYIREPNPFIKLKKEKELTKICIKLLPLMGFRIESVSILESKKGPDIIALDVDGNKIPIEIKAYQKSGKIGKKYAKYSHYFGNELEQLKSYMKELASPSGILITSANKSIKSTAYKNVKILFGKDLENLLKEFNLKKEQRKLQWIRTAPVSVSKEKTVVNIRKRILQFVKKKVAKGKYVNRSTIDKMFAVNVDSYFKDMNEIYELLNIDKSTIPRARMGGHVNKQVMRERILNFIKTELKSGRNPTYKEIQRKFGCLLTLFFPDGIREMHKCLGLDYHRKFANKTPEERERIKSEIIEFIRERHKNGQTTIHRNIQEEFQLNISNYFAGMREAYQAAGIEIGGRKGLRIRYENQ